MFKTMLTVGVLALTACGGSSGSQECEPNCTNRNCGDDGCGGSCGECSGICESQVGQCMTIPTFCIPSCVMRSCGDDGCGGSCGQCTNGACDSDGVCK
jgi:hypothetical protein